jgi:hypothetical protein
LERAQKNVVAGFAKLLGPTKRQVINRDVHAEKCAAEAQDRRAARLLEIELS